jgi:hypothetical protein
MGLRLIHREFTDSNSRTGSYPKGVALDTATAKYTIEYVCTLNLSTNVQVIKKGKRIRLSSGTWESLIGAYKGANIEFKLGGASVITTTIDSVDGVDLYLTNSGSKPNTEYAKGRFTLLETPKSFSNYVNLYKNSFKTGTKYSLIDNEVQWFKVELNNALSVLGVDQMQQHGKKSGGSIITSQIERIADVSGNQRYEITTNFKYWNFLDASVYDADDSTGFYTNIVADTVLDSTIAQINLEDSILGDVGYQNEALNGGESPYTLTYCNWTDDSSNVLSAFDYGQNSNFEIRIEGTFTGNEEFNFKFYRLADQSEYSRKELPVENNVSVLISPNYIGFGVPRSDTGNENSSGARFDMTNFTVTNNTTHVIITGRIAANAAMTTYLENNVKNYEYLVAIDDPTLTYSRATTVNVLTDSQEAIKTILPLGAYTTTTLVLEDINNDTLTASPVLMAEDYVRLSSTLVLPKNTDENVWKSITLRVIALKNDGSQFTLESFVYNVEDLPAMRDGTLLLDYNQPRGYKLPTTSNKNAVTVSRLATLDTVSDFGVEVSYAFQVRNEDFIQLPDASKDFFGEKTNKWYTYSSDPDYTLQAELVLERNTGIYRNALPFGISLGTITPVLTFERLDGTAITKPLRGETTRLISTTTAPTNWNGGEWGSISVRGENDIVLFELSTLEDPTDNSNPLQPDTGETRLKIDISGNDLVLTCLFDPSKLTAKSIIFGTRAHGNTI